MKLTLTTFLSIDGVMQAPGMPDEDRSDGFSLGGWSAPLWSSDSEDPVNAWFAEADAFLLGRRTYEIFESYWPAQKDSSIVAAKLNSLPKYVATTRPRTFSWEPTTALTGDVVAEVRKLKAQPGRELQVHGSGDLAQTLLRHGLIDAYQLWTYPVVLGSGRRLFADGTVPAKLRQVDTTVLGNGAVITTYQPDGELEVGSF